MSVATNCEVCGDSILVKNAVYYRGKLLCEVCYDLKTKKKHNKRKEKQCYIENNQKLDPDALNVEKK